MDEVNIAREKLEEYRRWKKRELLIKKTKLKGKALLQNMFVRGNNKKTEDEYQNEPAEDEAASKLLQDDSIDVDSDTELESVKPCRYIDWLYYSLWFILWTILYIIFIQLEFGLVYLVVSGLVAMYLNTRTTPRKANEASAYSVFNKNCESIDGTLKAEQFERELIYGPTAVR